MWKVGMITVPVITTALSTIKKESDQNLHLFSGHLLFIKLQKIKQMNTAHIICKMLG